MASANAQGIKEVVREHYAEYARSADKVDSSCCDDASCCSNESALYTIGQIGDLPSEAVAASAGCGNPTALASLSPGETVVDFGSGGGIDCFLAAKAVGPSGKVIGIDMTQDMVNLARKNAETLGLSNVEFRLTEIEDTQLDDNSTDVIISNCVICLAPDKDNVFAEAIRILRPGGRLFVSDMVLVEELPEDVTEDMENWVCCLGGAELKSTYLNRLAKAGFREVEIISDTPYSESEGSEGTESWRSKVHSMSIKAIKSA